MLQEQSFSLLICTYVPLYEGDLVLLQSKHFRCLHFCSTHSATCMFPAVLLQKLSLSVTSMLDTALSSCIDFASALSAQLHLSV